MGLFKKKQNQGLYAVASDSAVLAQRALDFITEGVLLIDENGMIQFANPAIARMTGYGEPSNITGLDYQLIIRLETPQAVPVEPATSDLYTALKLNRFTETRAYYLVSAQTEKKFPVAITCIPTGTVHDFRIVTFRDIAVEVAEDNEQAEFISTASHEMRTPVASIEGYLGLALNPQTATIDARARQYLEAAHKASQHLGNLFRDLLDVTKLDDKRLKAHLVPVNAVETIYNMAIAHSKDLQAKQQRFGFGNKAGAALDKKQIQQKIFMATDMDFLHEIVDNLVGNAIKYTPEGGEIIVDVQGDGDQVLLSVKDNGIGISAEDAAHIFQKFYRVDNSQTRQIGGTGLGLYLVKKRAEALGGRVWLESTFGQGSTFFVALPRLSESEYEKMQIAHANEQMIKTFSAPAMQNSLPGGVTGQGAIGLAHAEAMPVGGGQVAAPAIQHHASQGVPAPVVGQGAISPPTQQTNHQAVGQPNQPNQAVGQPNQPNQAVGQPNQLSQPIQAVGQANQPNQQSQQSQVA